MAYSLSPSTTKSIVLVNASGSEEKPRSNDWALKPAPFFFYRDRSQEPDEDPTVPVTAPGRVANFPAKMHEILNNPDLANIVTWCPHGRAWRILKPRQFEIHVLPHYFQHQKLSSFVRQANGWGFRRLSQGHDRNSYYHEYFLRGLPHLVKKMRRPKVAEKKAIDPEHEPDFYSISRKYPVPYNCLPGRREQDEKDMNRIMTLGNDAPPQETPSPVEVVKVVNNQIAAPVSPMNAAFLKMNHPPAVNVEAFGNLPPGLMEMIRTNPHFAAGFVAASTFLGHKSPNGNGRL
mmetsp:Transcript_16713/g.33271  ORF Transcript_16713/g.33271 Transcript_16713/m.33271 type:complete len:290 (-) Transcript_16713:204-1073(-)